MKATVYYNKTKAGILEKVGSSYFFQYDDNYLQLGFPAISFSLPKRKTTFEMPILFPFFSGLLSEGINKEIQCRVLKIDEKDDFGRLLKTAKKDTIGAITVQEI
jgi:serine/threonine-protein kinase HipA